MFTEIPIVPRCADGSPRVFIFHRSSRLVSGWDEAQNSFAEFQRRVDVLLDSLCRGPRRVTLLSITGSETFDDEAALATLMRAIDTDRCDLLIVESLSRISREPCELHNFLSGLGQTGVRLVAIEDGFDSAVESLPVTFGLPLTGGSVPPGAVDLNGFS